MASTQVDGANWNSIFYGDGHQDVQLTNTLYGQRYGSAGTTPGYVNTVQNPASGPNPSNMSGAANAAAMAGNYGNAAVSAPAPAPAPIVPPAQTPGSGVVQPTQPPANNPAGNPANTPGSNNPGATLPGGAPTGNPTALLREWVESDPNLALNMVANHFMAQGASGNFMTWFRNNFQNLWGRFLGFEAEQALNGQVPNISFVDYVKGFDTNGAFFNQTGSQGQSSGFANYATAQGAM